MRPYVALAASGSGCLTQGLASPVVAGHSDAGPVPVTCSHGAAANSIPDVTPLRPRQDLDPNVAAKAAIDAMNTYYYSSSQSVWSPGEPWWLSGVALTSIIDYMRKIHSTIYLEQVKDIIRAQRTAYNGEFRGASTDDTGWWALAMIRMYDLTGDGTYLDIAKEDEAYMYKYWTAAPCGGGMFVDIKTKTYKNAIANELYIKLTASLHNRVANDTTYLTKAETAWTWLQASGMINSAGLINDGLASQTTGLCYNNGLPVWTYNQGVILGALVELYRATSSTSNTHLTTARTLANAVVSPAATTNPQLTTSSGILTEAACQPDEQDGCNQDQQIFKGIFAANLAELDEAVYGMDGSRPYKEYLRRNAQSAWERARGGGTGNGVNGETGSGSGGNGESSAAADLYDVGWAGPWRNSTIGKQASAVGLLVAVI